MSTPPNAVPHYRFGEGPRLLDRAAVEHQREGEEEVEREAVAKITRSRHNVAPGYVLAISDEYAFNGMIMHAQYDVDMVEIRSTITVRNANVNVTAKKYTSNDRTSFAANSRSEARPRTAS